VLSPSNKVVIISRKNKPPKRETATFGSLLGVVGKRGMVGCGHGRRYRQFQNKGRQMPVSSVSLKLGIVNLP